MSQNIDAVFGNAFEKCIQTITPFSDVIQSA